MIDTANSTSKRGSYWAWVPVGLLVSMTLGLSFMAYVAVDDPGFALEPDYYDKAVHWDRAQAEARQSQALGYELTLLEPLRLGATGEVELRLALRDKHGSPLSGANIEIDAFPNARATRVEHLSLSEVQPGIYRGALQKGVSGLWEMRLVAHRGVDCYRQVLRLEVGAKGSTA